jgi:putative spermidine/putrescine transport system permease protein
LNYSLGDYFARTVVWIVRASVLVVVCAPIVITVVLSFSTSFTFPPEGFTVSWYRTFLSQPSFASGLTTSVLLAACTVAVSIAVGTGLALVLVRRRFRGAPILTSLVLSPLAIPRIAVGVSLLLFFVNLGVTGAFRQLLLLHVIITTPYVLGVVTASLQGMDESVERAAMNLGAGRLETFRRVTLPLIKPGLVAGAIFCVVVSLDEVTASTFLVDAHTTTYPVVLFSYMERGGLDPTVAAASAILLVPVLVLIVLLDRYVGLGRALGVWRES